MCIEIEAQDLHTLYSLRGVLPPFPAPRTISYPSQSFDAPYIRTKQKKLARWLQGVVQLAWANKDVLSFLGTTSLLREILPGQKRTEFPNEASKGLRIASRERWQSTGTRTYESDRLGVGNSVGAQGGAGGASPSPAVETAVASSSISVSTGEGGQQRPRLQQQSGVQMEREEEGGDYLVQYITDLLYENSQLRTDLAAKEEELALLRSIIDKAQD